MKIGDKLYCKKGIRDMFIIGNFYIINNIGLMIAIKSESEYLGYFFIDTISEFFYTLKEYRKLKLKQLNNEKMHL